MSNMKFRVTIQPRSGHYFRPPQDLSRELQDVGAGSGLWPFMGFLEERREKRNGENMTGDCWIVFGCRILLEDDRRVQKILDRSLG